MIAPTTVVFDLGGVLIDWDPRHLYRKMFDDAEEMERFLADVCNIDWILQLDGGLPFEEAVPILTAQHPHMSEFIEAYWKRWPEMIIGAVEGTVDILKALKAKQTPLYVLSNWSVETWPHARDQFDFLDLFDGLIVSGFEGTKKPDSAIFDILLERYTLEAPDVLFIDDRADNIAAAQQLGFHAIQFSEPKALSNALTSHGLL